jgi:transposase InsO family protein
MRVAHAGARRTRDRVGRRITAEAPNVPGVADATYIPSGEGFLYLCGGLDGFSRCIVGRAMPTLLYTQLMLGAPERAFAHRCARAVILRSNQESQLWGSHASARIVSTKMKRWTARWRLDYVGCACTTRPAAPVSVARAVGSRDRHFGKVGDAAWMPAKRVCSRKAPAL